MRVRERLQRRIDVEGRSYRAEQLHRLRIGTMDQELIPARLLSIATPGGERFGLRVGRGYFGVGEEQPPEWGAAEDDFGVDGGAEHQRLRSVVDAGDDAVDLGAFAGRAGFRFDRGVNDGAANMAVAEPVKGGGGHQDRLAGMNPVVLPFGGEKLYEPAIPMGNVEEVVPLAGHFAR